MEKVTYMGATAKKKLDTSWSKARWGRYFITSESDFIVRSDETDFVDTYPFLAFPDLTYHLEDTGIGIFWLHCASWYRDWTFHQ